MLNVQRAAVLFFDHHTLGQLQRHAEIIRAVVIKIRLEGAAGTAFFLGRHNVRLVLP
ncbi:hypothetical protein D3C80_2166830 [compost metagenome]